MARRIPRTYAAVIILAVVAQLLDLTTFAAAVARVGIGAETNPMAQTLYAWNGPMGAIVLKLAAITIILLALARIARRFPRSTLMPAALVAGIALAGMGLIGAASNVRFGLLG